VAAGGQDHELRRGGAVWLLPGHWHVMTRASSDLVLWVAMFEPDLVELARGIDASIGHGRAAEHVFVAPNDLTLLSQRFFRMLRLRMQRSAFDLELTELLVHAWQLRDAADDCETGVHPAVARAATLLTSAEEQLSLPALARRAGLSPFQLSRAFHARMGVTLTHYANHQRVQRFESLFGAGERYNLLEAALAAGFGSYSQFFRVYRAVTGWSPEVHVERAKSAIAPRERWVPPLGAPDAAGAVGPLVPAKRCRSSRSAT
jgi:AraC-like DNA-binding protein